MNWTPLVCKMMDRLRSPRHKLAKIFPLLLFSRRSVSCIVMQSDNNGHGQALSLPAPPPPLQISVWNTSYLYILKRLTYKFANGRPSLLVSKLLPVLFKYKYIDEKTEVFSSCGKTMLVFDLVNQLEAEKQRRWSQSRD